MHVSEKTVTDCRLSLKVYNRGAHGVNLSPRAREMQEMEKGKFFYLFLV